MKIRIPEDISDEQVALAEAIARLQHNGQFRKAGDDKGKPYIVHPERLAKKADTNVRKAAAWLHDVVEDTNMGFGDLLKRGIDERVIYTLRFLTKQHGENYLDFILRIMGGYSIDAMYIKLLDLEDNMMSLDEGSLKDKYRLAYHLIKERLDSFGKYNFNLNDKELESYIAWKIEHDKTCKYADPSTQGAIGGRITYIFTPTSLGCAVEIECACGVKENVTDYDGW